MRTIRRLYQFVVAGAALGMLVVGLAQVGSALIEMLAGRELVVAGQRQALAVAGSLVAVGLPVWGVHWAWAQRQVQGDIEEARSILRRLYLYLATGVLAVTAAVLASALFAGALRVILVERPPADAVELIRTLWWAAITSAFWLYHFRVVGRDRHVAGESGGSATLRRWYAYGVQFVGLVMLLFGARDLLRAALSNIIGGQQLAGGPEPVAGALAQTAVGLAVWLLHVGWTDRASFAPEDRLSQLRAVQGFLALAIVVSTTLGELGQAIYFLMARSLGVAAPGGVRGDILSEIVKPGSTIVVFGAAWALLQRRLTADASAAESIRQQGVRRLYTYLVAFVSLAILATGMGGVLWTLSDSLFSALRPASDLSWRDQLSFSIAAIVVGLPMWIVHWRAQPPASERLALSRRLYLFGALLASVLALLGSGATLVYRVLSLVLAADQAPALEIGRALSTALIAGAVAGYHFRVLRLDQAAARGEAETAKIAEGPTRQSIEAEIYGATPEQITEALAHLPAEASYTLRPGEGIS